MNAGLVFNGSSNIELRDFTIDSCGVQIIHKELADVTGNASKSIVFVNTTNVVLQGLVVANSNGYGLMISDCFGSTLLNNIIFENNKVIDSELEYTYGGGGLVIVFIPYQKQQKTQYTISNCKFEDNSANIRKSYWDSEKGGGMSLIFLHYSQDIYIKLEKCYFKNNTGLHGGGLFSHYSDNSTNCHLAVYNTEFYGNHATTSSSNSEEKAGGGVQLGFSINPLQATLQEIPMNNSMLFDSVNFTANTAYNGGGASLFISSKGMMIDECNNITFRDCAFVNNSGNGGSALEIIPSYTEQQRSQFIGQVLLVDCVFTDNVPNPESAIGQESTLFTYRIPVTFSGSTKFCNNGASAIYASLALLIFQEYTRVNFSNNVGSRGGAMFLAGQSRMLVYDNTAFQFTNNTASYGGAICSLPSDISILYGDTCFLTPQGKYYKNISFYFAGNEASKQIGNEIFVSSLASCCNFCQSRSHELITPELIFSSQCIGNFTFVKTGAPAGSNIATSPLILNTSLSYLELTPGLPHELNITQTDELGNVITDLFHVTAETEVVTGLVSYVHVANHNNSITLCGKPRTTGKIILKNNAPVVRRKQLDFSLSQCQPGFSLDKNACTCSAASKTHKYFQMPYCNKNSALITHGFWVGYIGDSSSEDTLFTGACSINFCSYKGKTVVNGYNKIPTSIKAR